MTVWKSPYQPGGALAQSGCETAPGGVAIVSTEEFLAPVQSWKTVVRLEGWVQSPPSSGSTKKERHTQMRKPSLWKVRDVASISAGEQTGIRKKWTKYKDKGGAQPLLLSHTCVVNDVDTEVSPPRSFP